MSSVLRNIATDLVRKRLWPIAVLLVLALVAVPVAIGRGSGEAVTAPPLVPPSAEAGDESALLTLADARTGGGRGGVLADNDPFRKVATAKKKAAAAPGTATPFGEGLGSGSGSGAASGSGSGSATGPGDFGALPGLDDIDVVPVDGDDLGPGTGTPPVPPVKTPAGAGDETDADGVANDSYHVDLRFGPAGAVENRDDVARLTPLPSQADPFFVFLGVLADGETAMFLVSSDAKATGDGTCKPTPESCERIEVKAGDTVFFDFTTPAGETVQYQLDLRKVQRRRAPDATVASAARKRESVPGRTILRAAVRQEQVDVSDLAYSRELGLLVPTGGDAQEQPGGLFGGYRTDLRFGPSEGEGAALVKRYNLARLTPLPSTEDPSFVFLGVMDDGASALFLNPTGAKVSGDGVCLPDPESCQRVQVAAGATATLDVPTLAGGTTAYALAVDAISEVTVDDAEAAAAAKTRESPAGRAILRRMIDEIGDIVVGDLMFSAEDGTLKDAPEGE